MRNPLESVQDDEGLDGDGAFVDGAVVVGAFVVVVEEDDELAVEDEWEDYHVEDGDGDAVVVDDVATVDGWQHY